MIRLTPTSTLFPYTTLFRSCLSSPLGCQTQEKCVSSILRTCRDLSPHFGRCEERSEEHTSELQSPMYLVCRLLLEKKKSVATIPSLRSAGSFESTTRGNSR